MRPVPSTFGHLLFALGATILPTIALCSDAAIAASSSKSIWAAVDEWITNNLIIQKSFTGSSKDSQAPASFAYNRASDGGNFEAIDFAAKSNEFDLGPAGKTLDQLTFSASSEWHRTTYDPNVSNKLSAAGTLEYQRQFSFDKPTAIFTDVRYNITRDVHLNQNSGTSSILLSYYSEDLAFYRKLQSGHHEYRWAPEIAYERYANLPIKENQFGKSVVVASGISIQALLVGFSGQAWLFPDSLADRLVLTVGLAERKRLQYATTLPVWSRLLAASLDYYFTESRTLGVGFNFQTGRDPARNFLNETTSSIGIKYQTGK